MVDVLLLVFVSPTCKTKYYLCLLLGDSMFTKRKSARFEMEIFVEHILGQDEHCLCLSRDFSSGGVSVSGAPGRGWGKPRHVWLQFTLPQQDRPRIRALAEVRYDRELDDSACIRGFRFKYMSPRERCIYNDFVAQRHMAT